jgi:hypothetical protein
MIGSLSSTGIHQAGGHALMQAGVPGGAAASADRQAGLEDTFQQSESCTPEIQQKIESLISHAYNTEDAWKFAIGMSVVTGIFSLAIMSGGLMIPAAGAALFAAGFGTAAHMANNEYEKTVQDIRSLNQQYNCGYTEKAA